MAKTDLHTLKKNIINPFLIYTKRDIKKKQENYIFYKGRVFVNLGGLGQGLNANRTGCASCSDGKYSPDETEACGTCDVGREPLGSKGGCIPCHGKAFSNDGAACVDCASGKVPVNSATQCAACAAGLQSTQNVFSFILMHTL